MVRGGEARSSATTGAGDILWQTIFGGAADSSAGMPLVCTDWDPFHREDIACTRARSRVPLAEELFAIAAL
eukprot:7027745-Alexandrium_andersonii.AAC.1